LPEREHRYCLGNQLFSRRRLKWEKSVLETLKTFKRITRQPILGKEYFGNLKTFKRITREPILVNHEDH